MHFLLIILFLNVVQAIKTIDMWNNLFLANPRSLFISDDSLHAALTEYTKNIKRYVHHPFVIQFSKSCGQVCHEAIGYEISKSPYSHYGIINTDHALVHLSYDHLETISRNFDNLVVDFAPVLPIMKIDKDIELDVYCSAADSPTVPLHVVFMPITDDDIKNLINNSPSEWGAHTLEQFDELSPLDYSTTVLIESPCEIAQSTLAYLCEQSFVQWIEVRPQMTFFTEWANGITESGDDTVNILNEANLTGMGEVIGIADTGLDMMSCFFHDPNVKAPYDKIDHSHRKVVYYETFADDNDQDGHGTLVCGTAAGQDMTRTAETDAFNAAAFRAKISFFDIGTAIPIITIML